MQFMGSLDNRSEARIILVGAPMDFTVSFRPGTRRGPHEIRSVSEGLEDYSFDLDNSLENVKFFDEGDLELPFGNVGKSLELIKERTEQILKEDNIPFFLGGEHLISYPVLDAMSKYYNDLVLLHFDAHADLRTNYMGESQSHATVIRKACDLIGGKNVYQFGIRSGTREEFQFAKEHTNLFYKGVYSAVEKILPDIQGRPIYLTIDIDVLDPAYAPGTGTPEPGGISADELFKTLYLLKDQHIVGMDLVEIAPFGDQSWRTALTGAKIVRELLLMFG